MPCWLSLFCCLPADIYVSLQISLFVLCLSPAFCEPVCLSLTVFLLVCLHVNFFVYFSVICMFVCYPYLFVYLFFSCLLARLFVCSSSYNSCVLDPQKRLELFRKLDVTAGKPLGNVYRRRLPVERTSYFAHLGRSVCDGLACIPVVMLAC